MTSSKSFRRRGLGLDPLYAVVGAGELAADKLRELGAEAEEQARAKRARASARTATDSPAAGSADPTPGGLRDLVRLARGARRAPFYVADQVADQVARTQEVARETAARAEDAYRETRARAQEACLEGLARTQETYADLAGRGRHIAAHPQDHGLVPAPFGALRHAADEVARRRAEAQDAARAAFDVARSAATSASTVFGGGREAATQTVVVSVEEGRRRSLRDAATDLGQEELRAAQGRGRRRTAAAARTAAPGPTRPVVEPEMPVRTRVPAGSGVEAGSTVTPATGTAATPRVAGARRRIRVADAVDGVVSGAPAPAAGPASEPETGGTTHD